MSKNDVQIVVGDSDYDELLRRVGDVIQKGRNSIATAVNNAIVQSYWEIGQYIVEYEQKGHAKAEYGSDVLNRLSRDMTDRFGKGFSRSNVFYMRKIYSIYPQLQQRSSLLSWSHYIELLKLDDELERSFYEKECESEHWGVRELKRQMKSIDRKSVV